MGLQQPHTRPDSRTRLSVRQQRDGDGRTLRTDVTRPAHRDGGTAGRLDPRRLSLLHIQRSAAISRAHLQSVPRRIRSGIQGRNDVDADDASDGDRTSFANHPPRSVDRVHEVEARRVVRHRPADCRLRQAEREEPALISCTRANLGSLPIQQSEQFKLQCVRHFQIHTADPYRITTSLIDRSGVEKIFRRTPTASSISFTNRCFFRVSEIVDVMKRCPVPRVVTVEVLMLSMRVTLVASVLAFTIACGSSSSSSPASPSPSMPPSPVVGGSSSSVTIPSGASTLGNRAFAPDDLAIAVGTTVTWTNSDSVAHTSTSDGSGWNSGTITPGGRFSFAFQTAGTFPYHCAIHPGMIGTIVVR